MALRKFWHQRAGKWAQALPLAVWGLNDLPGLIAPIPPTVWFLGGTQWGLVMSPPLSLRTGRRMLWGFDSGWLPSGRRYVIALPRFTTAFRGI